MIIGVGHRMETRGGCKGLFCEYGIKHTFKLVSATLYLAINPFSGALAQITTTNDTIETAKPADTISPYGVSYISGSFTYSLPLFTIGHGEWPNAVTVVLNYDSSGARSPNSAWTLSTQQRMSGTYERFVTGFEGDIIESDLRYALNLVIGNRSKVFYLGGPALDQPLNSADFEPASIDGSFLEAISSSMGYTQGTSYHMQGEFKATASDGTTINFVGEIDRRGNPLKLVGTSTTTLPSGHEVEFSQPNEWNGAATYIGSTSGLFFRKFGNQICAFNATHIEPSSVSDCSQSTLKSTITTARYGNDDLITSVVLPGGGTYRFEYESYYSSSLSPDAKSRSSKTRYHLSCVKKPGQSVCAVRNTYEACDGSGWVYFNPHYFGTGSYVEYDSEWSGSRDRVISQVLADGKKVSYAYTGTTVGMVTGPCDQVRSVTMTQDDASIAITLDPPAGTKSKSAGPTAYIDELGRETRITWTGANPDSRSLRQNDKPATVELPDGRLIRYTYDDRGNRIWTHVKARPGSGDADLVTSASFPATCSVPKICNQPTSVTDANGNISEFTYSPVHGGILTEVGPVVDGISRSKKYYYVQREAWFKSGSGYARTGKPVWLLSEERSCKSTTLNLSNGACAGGANDLVRVTYDYGPNSGPNNLFLRGVAITAHDSSGARQTVRTCFGYDQYGRKISETAPNANLASCS